MCTQSDDFKYFVDNHDELLNCYNNKFIVISNQKVHYAAETFAEALSLAIENGLPMGSFIIQQCTEGDSAYTQTFHSRPLFA